MAPIVCRGWDGNCEILPQNAIILLAFLFVTARSFGQSQVIQGYQPLKQPIYDFHFYCIFYIYYEIVQVVQEGK